MSAKASRKRLTARLTARIPDIWFAARGALGESPAEAVDRWLEQERFERAYKRQQRRERAASRTPGVSQ